MKRNVQLSTCLEMAIKQRYFKTERFYIPTVNIHVMHTWIPTNKHTSIDSKQTRCNLNKQTNKKTQTICCLQTSRLVNLVSSLLKSTPSCVSVILCPLDALFFFFFCCCCCPLCFFVNICKRLKSDKEKNLLKQIHVYYKQCSLFRSLHFCLLFLLKV